jgi:hypothetical protein
MMKFWCALTIACLSVTSTAFGAEKWVSLFNGKNLDGWTPKITGFPLGENFGNTFRVEDGVIKVVYDQYDGFKEQFGHLFYKTPYSHYRLRMEYRFTGEQCEGGPGWAFRNSGVMLHCQDPKTMTVKQDFPVSIEVQFLGGKGDGRDRATCNLCTPGTHVEMEGKLVKRHCTNSASQTYHGDQWVSMEVEVRGNEKIIHKIDGKEVMHYEKPQLDPTDPNTKKIINGENVTLGMGYFSLQSESHPVEFRKIEILEMK